ncbi:amiloride-sensitive sodium channel subunit gamma-like [Panonychus citri]|nr:amiloride-sensitive sodium channel subunit gamma-like [Panonychus citri]
MSIDHGPYTSQFCLKLCLQTYTLTKCDCWTVSAPPPNNSTRKQCNLRRNPGQAQCVERVRENYYAGELICNCPPRCNEKVYEKFISTGIEAAQCSALSSGVEDSSVDHK